MWHSIILPVFAAPVLGSIIPTVQDVLSTADSLLHPSSTQYLEIHPDHFDAPLGRTRKLCVLHPRGGGEFDDEGFKAAHEECGKGGIIKLPDHNYTIGNPLTTHLENAILDVHGWISFSTDIDNWVAKRVPFEFQNLALGWIITGENYTLDGNDKGGIYGNGDVWYDWAEEEGNKYGRPMSFAITNSTNVIVKNWSVIQPQFWASITINSTNVLFRDFYVNATHFDPEVGPEYPKWIQNTDGCDTYRSHNITFENMVYQGGDDCIALKPNSSMITARNVTCYGGTGIAFGSVGQYTDHIDYIEDVYMEDLTFLPAGQDLPQNALYFKSWMGYPIGEPPNGGGGGRGFARNITIRDVRVEDVRRPVFLQSDLTYLLDRQGEGHNTGLFQWHDIHISNMSGTSHGNRLVWLDCSKAQPCWDWSFRDFDVKPGKDDDDEVHYVCNNVVMDGADGLGRCHPSSSKNEELAFAPWFVTSSGVSETYVYNFQYAPTENARRSP